MTSSEARHELTAADFTHGLDTRRVGRQVIVVPEVGSTNAYALEEIAPKAGAAADGCVVFAEYQTAGRGRLGRVWHSPRGASLTFTVLLCDGGAPLAPARLMMSAAIAVVTGISHGAEVEPVIRWPNDVYVGSKKLAGILVEVRALAGGGRATAVGIGVNCLQHAAHFPPELRDRATSVDLEAPGPVDRVAIGRAILRQLDKRLAGDGGVSEDQLAAEWRSHSADIGAHVTLVSQGQSFCGRIIDVQPHSGLLLQLDAGGRREFDPVTTTRL